MSDETTKVPRLKGASCDGEVEYFMCGPGEDLDEAVCFADDVEKLEASLARVTEERDVAQVHGILMADKVLREENARLRDKIGRQVDNVRVAARDTHTRMVEQLRHFNEFVSELEASDDGLV